jgi:glutamine amidotransferase
MCELFGWSADGPVSTTKVTLEEFFKRGGDTGNHDDGWGLGIYTGSKNALLFKDAQKGASSQLAKHLATENKQLYSNLGIAHIRYATNGLVHSGNAHPFVREFLGHEWIFAHNGVVSNAHGFV